MVMGMSADFDLFQVTEVTIEKSEKKDPDGKPYWVKKIIIHQGTNQHVDITLFGDVEI